MPATQLRTRLIRYARLLALAVALIPVGRTWAAGATLCMGPCGTNVETRQYSYSGYLQNLNLSSSRTLPFSLADFYQATDTTPGSVVPMHVSLTVQQTQDYYGTSLGTPSYDYWYSVNLGRLSISGSVVDPYQPSYQPSPLTDGARYSGPPTDSLSVYNPDFQAAISQSNLGLRSRSSAHVGLIASGEDRFTLSMQDESGKALDSNFPADNTALEPLFAGGQFFLTGDIAVYDQNGNVILPFSDSDIILLDGNFSSAAAAFTPTSTAIGTTCASGFCFPVINPPPPLVTPVPAPSSALLWLLGMTLLVLRGTVPMSRKTGTAAN